MSTEISRLYSFVDDKNSGVPITASRVDAELNQDITALNQKVIIKSSAPSSPIAGMLWLDSTNKQLKLYRNSEWVIQGIIHVGTSSPSTSQEGDLWYDTTNDVVKAYNGASYSQISINTAAPGAIGGTTPAAGTFTALEATVTLKLATTNQGDILYDNGTSLVRLTPGTAGKVLKTQGAAANPTWDYPSAQLGANVSKTVGTIYQATTDGIVCGFVSGGSANTTMISYSDSSATPSTVVQKGTFTFVGGGPDAFIPVCFLVNKNNYYQVTGGSGGTINFMPLGS